MFCFNLFAELNISVEPSTPVKQETFNIIFEITTQENVEPEVSFNPNGLEILGRSREVSLNTSIINGKFSSTRKIKVIYEAISDKSRVISLNQIKVSVGKEELKHNPVQIRVLDKKATPSSMFLRAEVSKSEVYIGEGIDLRYYLYSRVPIVQTEFKSFPKLDGFIKRFHKVDEREETVEYDGQIYRRSLKYSARIYPEKTGKVFVDPLRLNIQYATSRGNPFGSFGLAFNRFLSKGLNSPKIEVKVMALPTEDVPLNFTGLVGEHEFRFISNKQKYVVNEAIEAKLEVTGPGALEKMNPPIVYQDAALEQFDTKSDFTEIGMSSGRKVFDYTFLARADVSLNERQLKLAFFDPDEKKYKEKVVLIPSLTIGGGGAPIISPGLENSTIDKNEERVSTAEKPSFNYGLAAPLFESNWNSLPPKWPKYLVYTLILILTFQALEFLFQILRGNNSKEDIDKEIKALKKNGLEYSGLANLLFRIGSNKESTSLREVITSSGLPKKDKDYFLQAIEVLEKKNFATSSPGDRSSKKRVNFRQSAFNSLKREIGNERLQ